LLEVLVEGDLLKGSRGCIISWLSTLSPSLSHRAALGWSLPSLAVFMKEQSSGMRHISDTNPKHRQGKDRDCELRAGGRG
jgi:hypothetical protein